MPAGPGQSLRARLADWMAGLHGMVARLLPCACELCSAVQPRVVCSACERELLRRVPRCPGCALRWPAASTAPAQCRDGAAAGPRCPVCVAAPADFDAAVALGDYAPPVDALAFRLKHGARLALADWFAAALARRFPHDMRQGRAPQPGGALDRAGAALPPLVTAIPLAPARLAERGFNQSWEIARGLAARLGLPADPALLRRVRETSPQRSLPAGDRHSNVAGAFAVADGAALAGRHVLLVDDVLTTGATLSDAAHALKRQGAARVTAVVALRTPAPWQRPAPR